MAKLNTLIKYLFALLVGGAIGCLVFFMELSERGLYLALCDGFSLPAVLLLCFVCLCLITRAGGLDWLMYVGLRVLSPLKFKRGKGCTSYRSFKGRKRVHKIPLKYPLTAGCIYLTVAIALIVAFGYL